MDPKIAAGRRPDRLRLRCASRVFFVALLSVSTDAWCDVQTQYRFGVRPAAQSRSPPPVDGEFPSYSSGRIPPPPRRVRCNLVHVRPGFRSGVVWQRFAGDRNDDGNDDGNDSSKQNQPSVGRVGYRVRPSTPPPADSEADDAGPPLLLPLLFIATALFSLFGGGWGGGDVVYYSSYSSSTVYTVNGQKEVRTERRVESNVPGLVEGNGEIRNDVPRRTERLKREREAIDRDENMLIMPFGNLGEFFDEE